MLCISTLWFEKTNLQFVDKQYSLQETMYRSGNSWIILSKHIIV
jgi:hypothetical protein